MLKNLVTASLIAVAVSLWLLSGLFFGDSPQTERPTLAEQQQTAPEQVTPTRTEVRAQIIQAQPRSRVLVLRGRTESKRQVDIKAEISGMIVERPVERGTRVEQGDLLCRLAIDDREVAVAQARAAVTDAEIEYQGTLRLKEQGLQSETAIARAASRLASTRADLHRHTLNLERTRIVAPFSGMIENLPVNVGDYAVTGTVCATLIDLDPMLVTADVTETEVERLSLGDSVTGRTTTGREIRGELTFIGKQSDPVTRTYPVEVTVENADYSLRSGLTTTLRIAIDEVDAHRLSPALFTLDDSGAMGVRTIGKDNVVEFHPVRVIEDTPQGVWVTGLPETTHLITVGQEFVLPGQAVAPVYTGDVANSGTSP
jgi:multidrug efflux system membrane fusion protein